VIKIRQHITVYEHERIRLGQCFVGVSAGKNNGFTEPVVFDEAKLLAMQKHFGEKSVPYYQLIHKGIQFNEHVGVIQVGNLLIEVLPKADDMARTTAHWRNMLIDMMRAVGSFDISVTSSSMLKIKPNTILDVYIEMFVSEVEYLLRSGLIKKYRKTEANARTLKGSLMFGQNLQHNLVHRERFYVRHASYDIQHIWHKLLYATLQLLQQINSNAALQSRIGALVLFFPEMPAVKVSEAIFASLHYDRKTEAYRKAIEIARLLLLHYHPDVSKGHNNVLALMFDMNKLWEEFVAVSLRKYCKQYHLSAQATRCFWQANKGERSNIRPDIVLRQQSRCIVLDTKWKNLNMSKASVDDLRQMYVYHQLFDAQKTALIYPGQGDALCGKYYDSTAQLNEKMECSLLQIKVETSNISLWQKNIAAQIVTWAEE